MNIDKLRGFMEKMKIYSIIATSFISLTAIIMGIFMALDKPNSNTYMMLMLLFIVIDSVAIEIMLASINIKLLSYSYNNREYTIYAGVFNYYLFLGDKQVVARYDLHLFTPIILRYVDKDDLIEANISPVLKRLQFKINDTIIE